MPSSGFSANGTNGSANGVSNGNNSTNGASTSTSSVRHIWMVTGPAGCGKSTMAKAITTTYKLPYVEGDNFHPKANIDKMSRNIPLDDADRWDWLTILREECLRQIAPDSGNTAVVLTCSALKRKYRDVLRVATYFHPDVRLHFVYLRAADPALLLQRVAARQGHYMGPDMVQSQLAILEPPGADEHDVLDIDVARPLEEVKADLLARVKAVMGH